ncbi:hypothetical protein [Flammeovirga sp. SubArs3]|uniref:hypothetical protein n=1 Tax=Flammeovirga sp. SubArs3 TaxID=2995316 RepID=UPI00248B283F|nr:hypothetical protein [Flammeovirga sp. SubArs3]
MTITFNRNFMETAAQTSVHSHIKQGISISEIIQKVLSEKGEKDEFTIDWISPNEFEIKNISSLSLHSALLEIEKFGKKISYSKKTIIKID